MKRLFPIILVLMSAPFLSKALTYRLDFEDRNQHYVTVTIERAVKKNETVKFSMPVWTPGSYKVREFSQYIVDAKAVVENKTVALDQTDKNTWECTSPAKGLLQFTYRVYAFDLGVRTSYVDQYMAFLHGVSIFMYPEGLHDEEILIDFGHDLPYKQIEVALPTGASPNSFVAENYDLLADSPFALGTFDTITYQTGGVDHKIVMIGTGNYDLKSVRDDFKKITDSEAEMFNFEHPSKQYIHFIQNVESGGGGLEHLNCHTSQMDRWAYTDEARYKKFLGLVAHEYFHLWNVKRIRAQELGPFDYDTENYTTLLWVAEGITSYFDDLILKRVGIHNEQEYLDVIAYNINRFENTPGKAVMDLSTSSKLAWVKAYLPNDDSKNTSISYYNKGMLVSWLLDLTIIQKTDGKKKLDDVLNLLYQDYYLDKQRGFTYTEFIGVCNDVTGADLTPLFENWINTTNPFDYQEFTNVYGLVLENTSDKSKADFGAETKFDGGKCIVSYVHPDGAALKSGLSVNDEIISMNSRRLSGSLDLSSEFKPGDAVEIIYSRDGMIYNTTVVITGNLEYKYALKPKTDITDLEGSLMKSWLD